MTKKSNIRTHYEKIIEEKDRKIAELEKELKEQDEEIYVRDQALYIASREFIKTCVGEGYSCTHRCDECRHDYFIELVKEREKESALKIAKENNNGN